MVCPRCGSKIEDEAAFCPECGADVRAEVASAGAPAGAGEKPKGAATGTAATGTRKVLVAVGAGVAAAALALGALFVVPRITGGAAGAAATAAAADPVLHITVAAPGYTSSSTPIPIHIVGVTAQGETVNEVQYVSPADSEELELDLELEDGEYEVEVASAVVNADRSVTQATGGAMSVTVADGAIEVTGAAGDAGEDAAEDDAAETDDVDDDAEADAEDAEEPVDEGQADVVAAFVLATVPAEDVTPEMIQTVREYVTLYEEEHDDLDAEAVDALLDDVEEEADEAAQAAKAVAAFDEVIEQYRTAQRSGWAIADGQPKQLATICEAVTDGTPAELQDYVNEDYAPSLDGMNVCYAFYTPADSDETILYFVAFGDYSTSYCLGVYGFDGEAVTELADTGTLAAYLMSFNPDTWSDWSIVSNGYLCRVYGERGGYNWGLSLYTVVDGELQAVAEYAHGGSYTLGDYYTKNGEAISQEEFESEYYEYDYGGELSGYPSDIEWVEL